MPAPIKLELLSGLYRLHVYLFIYLFISRTSEAQEASVAVAARRCSVVLSEGNASFSAVRVFPARRDDETSKKGRKCQDIRLVEIMLF